MSTPSPPATMSARLGEVFYSTLNESFDTAITAVDEVYTARANMPGARDVDEDYDNGPQSPIAKGLDGARHEILKWRGKALPMPSFDAVSGMVDAGLNQGSIDDRKMLLETALSTMSSLPKGSVADTLNRKTITLLYRDLPHPPATFISNKYRWRQPDGSHNNPAYPELGKAGTPYARSVQGTTPMPIAELPDAGLIFDSLLKREHFVPHPSGNSAMMFGFATLVIHSCFRTNHEDWTVNDTSSYVDLSPLYGNSLETQLKLRRQDGTGKMWNDVFAEDRLLFLPPISCALLVLFCRNHNYIAEKLLQINEKNRFSNPPPTDQKAMMDQDDEIFNVARLVNCAHFAGIVFTDYLAAILGLSRDANPWSMDPFSEIRNADHTIVERGTGNANSVEFNLLYRWHATLSEPDVSWLERTFTSSFGNKPAEQITINDFKKVTERLKAMSNKDVRHWTFAGLERDADGKFKDDDLSKICMDATLHPAGAFKARGTPHVMRTVEIMTIAMARRWGVCTLNEFRKSLGLRPYTTFQEWNPNPEIWVPAQALYEQVDRLELYPGLQAEDTKPPGPGAGLCPGYTVSRAILADAIALTRGDRFYTTDFSPSVYTSWGYMDCQRNPANPGAGSMLGPLLLRTLPEHYPSNSVYTWFSMLTPDVMQTNLTRLGKAKHYTFERPVPLSVVKPIDAAPSVLDITGRGGRGYRSTYGIKAREIFDNGGYFSLLDDVRVDAHRKAIQLALFHNVEHTGPISRHIESKTRALIHQKSFSLLGDTTRCFDVVKDVVNLAPIHWIADTLGLPLKTHDHQNGTIFEQQADQIFKDIYSYIFHEVDTSYAVNLQGIIKKHIIFLRRYIEPQVDDYNGIIPSVTSIKEALIGFWVDRRGDCGRFYDSIVANGFSKLDVINDVIALAVLSTVELSHLLVHVINFYLNAENAEHRERIISAALGDENVSNAEMEGYVREAIRQDPATVGVMREATPSSSYAQTNGTVTQGTERVFISLKKAMADANAYPNPASVTLNRPKEQKLLLGDGCSKLLGEEYILDVGVQVLKAVFSLKNLRRAPGPSGTLRRYVQSCHGTPQYYYLDQKQKVSLWPTSMLLQYDQI
ncbi:hypothetical protein M408DRAFT_59813 [Serendipita vermifera MAFF 305830]|uniref:Heme peroxidase n=1 Tax=Serendipita vermifera MAFF 305830 TaxID=933852 RepID=A0A0C3BBN4_SERVB|nr:hypothetical protein M408DRAFT_59813 [Serendipita vermifera MAFF 305830]